jgi:2-keto-4-pentenoate hydratase/2-oxohepta-3-ene-1,7-dioic acid hydratase in catechol pathway
LVAIADEVGDPARLTLVTRLSGEEVQRTGVDRMFFGLQRSLRYISAITPLLPGDIIATGSPEGSGAQRQPLRWLEPSDRGGVEIERVGLLGNPIA